MKKRYEHIDSCGCGFLSYIKEGRSHKMVEDAVNALIRMSHRGAVGEDGKSGDGCGIMFSIPYTFFNTFLDKKDAKHANNYAVGMLFIKEESDLKKFEAHCTTNHLKVLLFRKVETDINALGREAKSLLPLIYQVFVIPNKPSLEKRFNQLLYLVQQTVNHQEEDIYICSLSKDAIVYKGLFMPTDIANFYVDLQNTAFSSRFAIIHQRFSTNTLPDWKLAQPFRTLAHNGEINSIQGNVTNFEILSEQFNSPHFSEKEMQALMPLFDDNGSDSANLDNVFQFLFANRYDFFKGAKSLLPVPWQNSPHIDPTLRAFYEFASCNFEPWDGPANVCVTNGDFIGCFLDRNGLRPAKYIITKDNRLVIGSEYGIVDIESHLIKEQGRLESGGAIILHFESGDIYKEEEINEYLKKSDELKPDSYYLQFLQERNKYLVDDSEPDFQDLSDYNFKDLINYQKYHNITNEVEELIFENYLQEGKEPTSSMGDDIPPACFSHVSRPFTDFFKQKFAQVTNPPIDPIREKNVMSSSVVIGAKNNIFDPDPDNCRRLKAISPVLPKEKLDTILQFGNPKNKDFNEKYKIGHFYTGFKDDLEEALRKLAKEVVEAVIFDEIRIVILDDRILSDKTKIIPMPMALGYVSNYLKEKKLRSNVSFVVVSGEIFDAHSLCVHLAYGAIAAYPYLLFASGLKLLRRREQFNTKVGLKNLKTALNKGILKILSKMGISTVNSYVHSGLFDIIGLEQDIAQQCFPNSSLLIPGLSFKDIEERIEKKHAAVYNETRQKERIYSLEVGSLFKYMTRGEYHDFSPDVAQQINKMALTQKAGDYEILRDRINGRGLRMIRDFLEIKSDKKPISKGQVEPVSNITARFVSAAMSLGSISPEAHTAIAEAMNMLGGMSNSGEGGEDRKRFGTIQNSKIKQVASGRFGVTPEYLRSAEDIQIKVAQGAKPGEGGQLPGHKVSSLIARLRYTMPGVTLISPPPHHDIYSIEDLAQLIYDLKQVNSHASVSVKLVSSSGVGTIAVGVAKAYADKIIISGGDGGTGAAQLSSIKHAGNPWEPGLIDAHNKLKENNLRKMVELETDGGLKTGLDVIKAALLGAESFGFGTAILSSVGCKILRICHLNKCSVGIATQNKSLREHFIGTVEGIINYLTSIAEEVREILADMGYTSLDEIIGRNYLLQQVEDPFALKFDMSALLEYKPGDNIRLVDKNHPRDNNNFEKEVFKELEEEIYEKGKQYKTKKEIRNHNRSFGAYISGEIAARSGEEGLRKGSVMIDLEGIAGQSFGAFLTHGVNLKLKGTANDYVGKGMHGGSIIIHTERSKRNLAGNTCLYGATGGRLYVKGTVGERFAVRNSGALAVVEGTGHHPCEYMTGGKVVILGKTGRNFGAGMTGGTAYVYDKRSTFRDKLNEELVKAFRIDMDGMDEERQSLKKILINYYKHTKSKVARRILANFRLELNYFWIIVAKDMEYPLNPFEGN